MKCSELKYFFKKPNILLFNTGLVGKKREIVFLLLLFLVLLFGDDETIATNLLSVKPLPVVTDPGVITKPACSTTVTQISSEWTVPFPQLGTFIPCKALLL